MANEISNMILAQRPGPVKESSQLVKPEVIKSSAMVGQALPSNGKPLPIKNIEQEALHEAVNEINDYVQTIQRDLSFSMDDQSGRAVVSVIDSASGDLIRQIPSEEVLVMARILKEASAVSTLSGEDAQGILFAKHTA